MQVPQVRTLVLSSGQFVTGAIAAVVFMSSKSVDLYAAWDQFYQGFKLMLGGWAIFAPIAIAAYQVYKASTTQKLNDIIKAPDAPAVAEALPVTPASTAVANAMKKEP